MKPGWISAIVVAGLLLAACSAPQTQDLSGLPSGDSSAEERLPVTGETVEADTETLEPSETPEEAAAVEETQPPDDTPEPTDTEEPAPPTDAPAPQQENGKFSLTTANGVAPEDIIREMTVAVEGKGDGPCFDKNDQVFLSSNERFLMEAVYVSICGWDTNEDITFTVTDPQGRVRSVTENPEQRDDQVMFRARYQPWLDDPTGNYHFVVESGTAQLEWDVTYNAPSGPHLYIVSENRFRPRIDTNVDHYQLQFAGFQSNESVRLFAYELSGQDANGNDTRDLVGWQDYEMDDNGNLTIEADAKDMAFLAYGQESGEVHLFTLKMGGGDLWDWFGSRNYFCPGAQPPRLNPFDQAVVDLPGGGDLAMLNEPGAFDQLFSYLSNGTLVFIEAGPRCAAGAYWWQVSDINGSGWAPETQDGEYVLREE